MEEGAGDNRLASKCCIFLSGFERGQEQCGSDVMACILIKHVYWFIVVCTEMDAWIIEDARLSGEWPRNA